MRLIFYILLFITLAVHTLAQNEPQPSNPPPTQSSEQPSATVAPSSNGPQAPASSGAPANSGGPVSGGPVATGAAPAAGGSNSTGSVNVAASNSIANLPTSASFGNTVYAAGASFITPTPSKSVSPLYRIDRNENVTFAWSFTNLLVRPSNLTLAAVGPNKITYTIATLDGAATSATWALSNVPASNPLMMGMYQVQLYDQRGISATYNPGWLAPATALTIAFYSAESYVTPTGADYCPTCFYNSARRMSINLGPIGVAFGIASFTSVFILYGLMY